jgi:glycosyltransferase involved in cell wall biosynthesis
MMRARGDFICFLDSDDYLLPNHLTEAHNVIMQNQETHIFHLNYEFRDEQDNLHTGAPQLPMMLNKLLIRNNVISCNSIFIARKLLERYRFSEIRDLSGTEDYLLWLRLAAVYPIRHVPVITSVVVNHESRSMTEVNFEKLRSRIDCFVEQVKNDRVIVKFIGAHWPQFRSLRYSYISLHAAIDGYKSEAWHYLKAAVRIYPLLLFSKRFIVILKHLLFSKGISRRLTDSVNL